MSQITFQECAHKRVSLIEDIKRNRSWRGDFIVVFIQKSIHVRIDILRVVGVDIEENVTATRYPVKRARTDTVRVLTVVLYDYSFKYGLGRIIESVTVHGNRSSVHAKTQN